MTLFRRLAPALFLGGCYASQGEPLLGIDGSVAEPCPGALGAATLTIGDASEPALAVWLDAGLRGRVLPWLFVGRHTIVEVGTDGDECSWSLTPDSADAPARGIAASLEADAAGIALADSWECAAGSCAAVALPSAELSVHRLDPVTGELCVSFRSRLGDGRPVAFEARAERIGQCRD